MKWNDFINSRNGKEPVTTTAPTPKETAGEIASRAWYESVDAVSWVHPLLAISSQHGAQTIKDAVIINVAEELNTPADIKMPVMPENGQDATMVRLNMLGEIIADHMRHGDKVVVHCMAGIERSVLTVAWFLKNHLMFGTLNNAYTHIKKIRPVVERRDWWVEGIAPKGAPMAAATKLAKNRGN